MRGYSVKGKWMPAGLAKVMNLAKRQTRDRDFVIVISERLSAASILTSLFDLLFHFGTALRVQISLHIQILLPLPRLFLSRAASSTPGPSPPSMSFCFTSETHYAGSQIRLKTSSLRPIMSDTSSISLFL